MPDSRPHRGNENLPETTEGHYAENIYGKYFIPASSYHRPVSQKIKRGEIHEPDTIQFIREHCGKGDVIHAGAYFGDFLPGIAKAMDADAILWAFEPNSENFHCAQLTCTLNHLVNVKLHHAALGESVSCQYLLIQDEHARSLGGKSEIVREQKKAQTELVDILTIDNAIPADRHVSIIQLDVEGYEKQALQGAMQTIENNRPILILEDNNHVIGSQWFMENIMSLGYIVGDRLHGNTLLLPSNSWTTN